MKIHITLVGGQNSPVYLGIRATKPELVVFIYSTGSKKQLNMLTNEIDIPYEIGDPLDPTNLKDITEKAMELKDRFINDEVVVNLSSGTKPWSIIFGQVFGEMENAKLIFVDQNNYVWDFTSLESKQEEVLDIARMFRLYGNKPSSFRRIEEYTTEDARVRDEIIIARNLHKDTFKQVTQVLSKETKTKYEDDPKGKTPLAKDGASYATWNRETNCAEYYLGKSKKGAKLFSFNSPHAVELLFNSNWFEYYIADILAHWEHSKEVFLNLIFPPKSDPSGKHPKNEIDIVVSTGVKYLFVECKTGISSSTDIDKFHSAVKAYGGSGNKELFITENKMDAIAREKCNTYHIIPFSLNSYPTREKAFTELFNRLSKELLNINI